MYKHWLLASRRESSYAARPPQARLQLDLAEATYVLGPSSRTLLPSLPQVSRESSPPINSEHLKPLGSPFSRGRGLESHSAVMPQAHGTNDFM